MTSTTSTPRRSRTVGVLFVACLALVGFVLLSPSSRSATAPFKALFGHGPTDADGGELPDGATAFDDRYAGIDRLDPSLLAALREASSAASRDRVEIHVNSGWRSRAYQERLLDEAVDEYGSREEAARWVATPDTSPHVSGDAVDIGGVPAREWLAEHGAGYGLCRVYDNEPWHFELRPDAVTVGCRATYPDPTYDPRLQD